MLHTVACLANAGLPEEEEELAAAVRAAGWSVPPVVGAARLALDHVQAQPAAESRPAGQLRPAYPGEEGSPLPSAEPLRTRYRRVTPVSARTRGTVHSGRRHHALGG